eukprot:m.188643 g.188643  ORF g.188643 m.188643 type:complete len:98 (+) comp25648_c0_seq1:667-960(+)
MQAMTFAQAPREQKMRNHTAEQSYSTRFINGAIKSTTTTSSDMLEALKTSMAPTGGTNDFWPLQWTRQWGMRFCHIVRFVGNKRHIMSILKYFQPLY